MQLHIAGVPRPLLVSRVLRNNEIQARLRNKWEFTTRTIPRLNLGNLHLIYRYLVHGEFGDRNSYHACISRRTGCSSPRDHGQRILPAPYQHPMQYDLNLLVSFLVMHTRVRHTELCPRSRTRRSWCPRAWVTRI